MFSLEQFRAMAKSKGLGIVDRGNGHLQIVGGGMLVNYYPQSKSRRAYVAGTIAGIPNATPEQALEMALRPPNPVHHSQKEKRAAHYRGVRFKMLQKTQKCHWCGCTLTLETSTVDHVIPLHLGGLDNANNRVLACSPCNQKRGHSMPELGTSFNADKRNLTSCTQKNPQSTKQP